MGGRKIGLVDVDSHNFPNLCLMKLSAWHKQHGDAVEWASGLEHYDIVYKAKVFSSEYTKDDLTAYNADLIVEGGTGYNLEATLDEKVEHCFPDYSIYDRCIAEDKAYGFLSRGCPRGCKFCIVGRKEGLWAHKVANLSEFWNGQKNLVLLDPNILACTEWVDLLGQVAESRALVDYNQGIDIRLMNDEKAKAINRIRYRKLHFAWDNANDEITPKMFKEYQKAWKVSSHNLYVYVLTNFNSTHEEDLYRIYTLRDMGYNPFVMVYDKPNAPKLTQQMQRWCNNNYLFWSIKNFEDYDAGKRWSKK